MLLYMAKMAVHHYDLLLQYEYNKIAAGCLYYGFKTMTKVNPSINPDDHMDTICESCRVNANDVMLCSAKMTTLAKSFWQLYPSLKSVKALNSSCHILMVH